MARYSFLKTRPQLIPGPTPDEKLEAIQTCLFAGDKIQAIRIYREWKGGGLAECKAAVEGIDAELRLTIPEKFQPVADSSGGVGCVAAVLLFLAVIAVIVGWWMNQ